MKNVVKNIIKKWYSLTLSFGTIVYGFNVFLNPRIFTRYPVYHFLDVVGGAEFYGMLALILGFAKLYGIIINNGKIKQYALTGLSGYWAFLFLHFMFSHHENTVVVLAGVMFSLALGLSLRGGYEHDK